MPSIETYFNDIILIPESRVLKSQLKMLHKESNIECVLLSDDVGSLVKSTQIIQSYIEIEPMCKLNKTFKLIFHIYLNIIIYHSLLH